MLSCCVYTISEHGTFEFFFTSVNLTRDWEIKNCLLNTFKLVKFHLRYNPLKIKYKKCHPNWKGMRVNGIFDIDMAYNFVRYLRFVTAISYSCYLHNCSLPMLVTSERLLRGGRWSRIICIQATPSSPSRSCWRTTPSPTPVMMVIVIVVMSRTAVNWRASGRRAGWRGRIWVLTLMLLLSNDRGLKLYGSELRISQLCFISHFLYCSDHLVAVYPLGGCPVLVMWGKMMGYLVTSLLVLLLVLLKEEIVKAVIADWIVGSVRGGNHCGGTGAIDSITITAAVCNDNSTVSIVFRE